MGISLLTTTERTSPETARRAQSVPPATPHEALQGTRWLPRAVRSRGPGAFGDAHEGTCPTNVSLVAAPSMCLTPQGARLLP